MTEGWPAGIAEAARLIRSGELTSRALVEASISRADEVDKRVGCYVTRFDETARAAAALADKELGEGLDRGPLHGIPIGVKDILTAREGPTTAQSLAQDPEWRGRHDATVVERLRQAGAVITGKTSLSEFACGFPDPEKPFPIPRNPWDLDRWAGGSSGGSASAVAADLVLGAVGTDTGGSVRIPVGFCGVTGLKTTWGTVDTTGCVPFAWSFDSIGPIARSAADCRAILEAIRDPGPAGARTSRRNGIEGMRIGVDPLTAASAAIDPGQESAFAEAIGDLERAGAIVVERPLPHYAEVVSANYVIMLTEGLAYHLPTLRTRWSDYGRSARQLFAGGVAFSGADYVMAQQARAMAWASVRSMFADVDVHLTPMATVGAPTLHDLIEGDPSAVLGSLHTPYWATLGCPTVALPIAPTQAGLPLSIQIAGPAGSDVDVLQVAEAFQGITTHHLRRPPL